MTERDQEEQNLRIICLALQREKIKFDIEMEGAKLKILSNLVKSVIVLVAAMLIMAWVMYLHN